MKADSRSYQKAFMDGASHHHVTQGWNAAAFPIMPQPLYATSEAPNSYPPDQKPDPSAVGTHPAESMQYGNSITPEDAQYLRKQAAEIGAPPTSPGPLPVKGKRELHPETAVVNIVPDENPLSPAFLSTSKYQNVAAVVSDSAFDNHLPGQAMHANQHVQGGTWKYGLCDCGDIGVCCSGVWCPCVVYGKTQYRLSRRSERKDPTNMLGYSMFNGSCAAFAVLCGCNLILAAIQHSRLRRTYDIPGGVGTDFVRACCCCCCTLSQDEKEIKYRENQARRSSVSPGAMQYLSPVGMDFSAPPK